MIMSCKTVTSIIIEIKILKAQLQNENMFTGLNCVKQVKLTCKKHLNAEVRFAEVIFYFLEVEVYKELTHTENVTVRSVSLTSPT